MWPHTVANAAKMDLDACLRNDYGKVRIVVHGIYYIHFSGAETGAKVGGRVPAQCLKAGGRVLGVHLSCCRCSYGGGIQKLLVRSHACVSMALRDITNTSASYSPQVKLDSKYAPVIKRGVVLESQGSRASFPERRAAGETHIDLWVDGALYPADPATNSPPSFTTTKEYLEFLCHGEEGMLGYTKRLSVGDVGSSRSNATGGPHYSEQMVMGLQSKVSQYAHDIQHLRQQCEELQLVARSMSSAASRLTEERTVLQNDVRILEATCSELRLSLTRSLVQNAQSTQRQESADLLEAELTRCRAAYEKLQADVKYMVETPMGLRKRVHLDKMKSVDELVRGSGYAKRRRTMIRAQLQPGLVSRVQMMNRKQGAKKRLGGEGSSQNATARAIASILSAGEALKLAEQPRMSQANAVAAQCTWKKIQRAIGEEIMLGVCDGNNVTYRGYDAMCKAVKHRVRLVAPELKGGLLPSTNRLAQLRRQMNAKLPQFIGDYYHIEGRRIIPEVRVGKTIVKQAKEVILNNKNNLFARLEVVQRSIVLFYDVTVEGK